MMLIQQHTGVFLKECCATQNIRAGLCGRLEKALEQHTRQEQPVEVMAMMIRNAAAPGAIGHARRRHGVEIGSWF